MMKRWRRWCEVLAAGMLFQAAGGCSPEFNTIFAEAVTGLVTAITNQFISNFLNKLLDIPAGSVSF